MSQVTKEVDAWFEGMSKLMQARTVAGDTSKMLEDAVEFVLKKIGNEALQQMDAAGVLVAVRNGLPKAPNNLLRPEYIAEHSDAVAKIVEQYFTKHKILSAGLKTFGDGVVNELEAQIAKYIAALPKDVKIQRDGLTIVLSKKGVAAKIKSDEWSISADAEPAQAKTKLTLETKDLKLNVEAAGKAVRFDGRLKYVKKDLDLLVELQARAGKFPDPQSSEAIALQGKIDATFEQLKVQATGSLEQFEAKLAYLSEDPGLKAVTARLATDYKTVKAQFDVFYRKRNTAVMVKALAAADRLEVELNAKALTAGGLDVQAEVKATLARFEAKLSVFKKNQETETKFQARLEAAHDDLKATAALIGSSTGKTRIQYVAQFEATLDRVRATIEAAIQTDSWRIGVGAGVDSQGAPSGKFEALLKLGEGFRITGQNAYLKVGASVDDKRWNLFVGISLTNPPKAADVKKLIGSAERNILGAYGVLGDSAYDGADSAKVLSEMQTRLKVKPPPIQLEAGFFLSDDVPRAGLPNLPMTGGVGLKLEWF